MHVEGSAGQMEQGWAPGAFLDKVTVSPSPPKSASLTIEPFRMQLASFQDTIIN